MSSTADQSRVIVLDRADSRLHAWVSGPTSAPLVVLVHGATMDHLMFNGQLEPLLAAGYQVMAVDLRGHGESKPLGLTTLTVSDLADDVLALVDEEGVGQFVVVGQSLGGYVAQDLVLRYPERITALGIIGSTCTTAPISRWSLFLLRSSLTWFRWWPYRHLQETMVKSLAHSPEVRSYAREAMNSLSKQEFLTVWEAVTRVARPQPGYRIEHPLLLTHGDHDQTGNIRKAAPLWAARDPLARYRVIPDARHNANQDNPRFFNRVLMEFLTEHAPVTSTS
ncbi:alpha/beta hydrolase [Arthrobacter sp. 260]|uniref:alpha/beta fold hydrolase n=1 Tax=Arthrobacter sp. 260 TaxID=2735314 RepID=UPI0014923E01|nr:alpha/beta hydrolase [Arthrobacter sp. 260]NOJ58940.1 alpha/beta hydrolase [Arthrobacter sp. 260]